jgi:hypothetical protein
MKIFTWAKEKTEFGKVYFSRTFCALCTTRNLYGEHLKTTKPVLFSKYGLWVEVNSE